MFIKVEVEESLFYINVDKIMYMQEYHDNIVKTAIHFSEDHYIVVEKSVEQLINQLPPQKVKLLLG